MTSRQLWSRRKLTMTVAGAATAIAFAIGGHVIAGSSSGVSGATNAGNVVPFQRGEPTPARVVGQVPAEFQPGNGMIVTGTAADKAAAAALAAYPGGTVNRVVLLSDGEYNVHMIAVNWPHHVFVSKSFKVV